ncbi:hypothetical protein [Pseudonocardia sp. WMMC193]|uniref:hypothetical protein n=1 Tax=Pseudonocardia sp. WMMC193 TaxID=2911965 RepID=UPI001F2E86B9|nr:hypothetical protein [Pseudonocardia sp. WMMC193]MCF7550852.1 hypothetical protein [Pseudonocardia sp. WMMC193]
MPKPLDRGRSSFAPAPSPLRRYPRTRPSMPLGAAEARGRHDAVLAQARLIAAAEEGLRVAEEWGDGETVVVLRAGTAQTRLVTRFVGGHAFCLMYGDGRDSDGARELVDGELRTLVDLLLDPSYGSVRATA